MSAYLYCQYRTRPVFRSVFRSEYSNGQLQQQETNSYDVFENLIEQDETSGGNTVVTKFANQVKNTSGVSQVWADLNSANQIQTRRVYLDAVDAVCARISSNGTEGWYLADHLGSVGAIMNNSGTVIDHDPWGNPTDSNPSAGDRYKFTGQEYDSVTSQYNYRARVYDAAIGRFTSQDPKGFAAGDMDLYRYCGNAPTVGTDPTGLDYPVSAVMVEVNYWQITSAQTATSLGIVAKLSSNPTVKAAATTANVFVATKIEVGYQVFQIWAKGSRPFGYSPYRLNQPKTHKTFAVDYNLEPQIILVKEITIGARTFYPPNTNEDRIKAVGAAQEDAWSMITQQ